MRSFEGTHELKDDYKDLHTKKVLPWSQGLLSSF
jgi:hypothetical protein